MTKFRIPLTKHNGKRFKVMISPDRDHPGRIFVLFPGKTSLTPAQAYALADALVDAAEEVSAGE